MKKQNAIIAAVLAAVVVGAFFLARPSDLQGRFSAIDVWEPSQYFINRGEVVSILTSPVLTTDTSPDSTGDTTGDTSGGSTGGTTPVSSAVAVPKDVLKDLKIDIKSLPELTEKELMNAAMYDQMKNPKKYMLNDMQIKQLIKMYEKMEK